MGEDEKPEPGRLSALLGLASAGAPGALGKVFEAAYPELRKLASARLRARGGGGLETTTVVHETFMRFAQRGELQAAHRGQFFKYAGAVMRSVIVDAARNRLAQRRGGGSAHVALDTQVQMRGEQLGGEQEILRVHEALDALGEHDPRLIDVVQLRYFGGMSDVEIAGALGVTDRTVRRDWEKARLLLSEALEG